jgi:hypothetical protein
MRTMVLGFPFNSNGVVALRRRSTSTHHQQHNGLLNGFGGAGLAGATPADSMEHHARLQTPWTEEDGLWLYAGQVRFFDRIDNDYVSSIAVFRLDLGNAPDMSSRVAAWNTNNPKGEQVEVWHRDALPLSVVSDVRYLLPLCVEHAKEHMTFAVSRFWSRRSVLPSWPPATPLR